MTNEQPLSGRTALVTGVSRRRGIGFGIARELARQGANLLTHHHAPHDREQPWGEDDLTALDAELAAAVAPDAVHASLAGDLRDQRTVGALLEAASAMPGRFDILVCNHARSGGDGSILDMDAETLDAFWQVDTRSTLTKGFAHRHAGIEPIGARPGDRAARANHRSLADTPKVVWMTSGQQDGPMRGEAYAASKAALAGVTATVAAELADLGIVLNTVNPGPVNTGYLDPNTRLPDASPRLWVGPWSTRQC